MPNVYTPACDLLDAAIWELGRLTGRSASDIIRAAWLSYQPDAAPLDEHLLSVRRNLDDAPDWVKEYEAEQAEDFRDRETTASVERGLYDDYDDDDVPPQPR